MWNAVGTSVAGTSHEKLQSPCQDACEYYSCILGSERVLLIAIADGAGSASASEIGSRETVSFLLKTAGACGLGLIEISENVLVDWFTRARENLSAVSEREEVAVRELACTVLFALLGESRSIFAQIGDGAWVARSDGAYVAATWPSGGEYANQTTFLTSPNWREAMQFTVLPTPLDAVAGFTDGLQNIALHFATRSVHAPFFDGKLAALRNADDETSLRVPLMEYLASAAVCERTDDDKTLVLACRKEVKLLGGPAL